MVDFQTRLCKLKSTETIEAGKGVKALTIFRQFKFVIFGFMVCFSVFSCTKFDAEIVSKGEFLKYLQSGEAVSVGVTASGWVVMEIASEGSIRVRERNLGNVRQLVQECEACGDLGVWIE